MALDAALLNPQHYKVRVKGKVEQSREWSSTLPYASVWWLLKKKAFRSPSTKVANFMQYFEHGIINEKKLIIVLLHMGYWIYS